MSVIEIVGGAILPFNQHRNPGFADSNRICRRT